jgi:acetyl esterase/lipase
VTRARRGVLAVLAVALLAAAMVIVRFGSAILFTAALALPALDARLARWSSVPTLDAIVVHAGATTLDADLYRPARARRGVLLVHGLSPAGRRHPEIVRLARLFSRNGYVVLVPQFEGLARFRLSGREIDEIAAALAELGRRSHPIAVAGFSFGAGPALVAAADAQTDLAWVGSFGGYADLRNVILYLTTGVHTFGGRQYRGRVEEYNRWKLTALLTPFVDDAGDRARLAEIASRKLANPSDDTGSIEARLGPGGAAMMRLVRSRRPEVTTALVAALPPPARAALERLSPLAVVPRLRSRLLLAHGVDDDSIPFTESLRLAEAAGPHARVVILDTFHHTGPDRVGRALSRRVTDGAALVLLVDEMLRAH